MAARVSSNRSRTAATAGPGIRATRSRAGATFALLAALAGAAASGPTGPARAQALDLQGLLTLACAPGGPVPGSALQSRCDETPGGAGGVSPASAASLTPSQFLSGNAVAIARAKDRTREIQEWLEDRRDREANRFRRAAPARAPGPLLPAAPTAETPAGGSAPEVGRLGLVANGRASWFDRSAGVQERGFDGTTHSALLGGDARLAPGAFLGGFVSYDRTDSEFDPDQPLALPLSRSGRLDGNAASFGLFGSYNLTHAIFLDGSFGYGFAYHDLERDAVFQDAALATSRQVQTRADLDGEELTASAALGYELQNGALTLGPYGRATYVRSEIEGHSETDRSGSGLAMRVEETARESFTTRVGARLSYALETPFGALVPQGRFEWEHEFLQGDRNQTTTFVLDTRASQLTLTGDAPDRSHLNLGAGLLLVLPGGWIPFVDYEGLVGDPELARHRLSFGLRAEL